MKLQPTRNTKLLQITVGDSILIFRQLNATEITMLDNLHSSYYKNEMATYMSLVDGYIDDISWQNKQQIGGRVITFSTAVARDDQLFEAIVKKHQLRLSNDKTVEMFKIILDNLPGTTIQFLMSQTFEDLVELVCICEALNNKRYFQFKNAPSMKVGGKKPTQKMPSALDGTTIGDDGKLYFHDLPDSSPTLKDKMKDAKKFYGK